MSFGEPRLWRPCVFPFYLSVAAVHKAITPPGTAQSRKAVVCNQRPGGSGEQRLPPLQFTKSRENLRKCSSRTQRLQTSGNSQGKVSGVSQGPCTTPELCASSLAPLHPSEPPTLPFSRGENVPLHRHGAGTDPGRKETLLFPPAFLQGSLSVHPRVCCAIKVEYFVQEESNLLRLPSGAEISPLPP